MSPRDGERRDILTLPPPPADARRQYGPDAFQFGDLRLPPGDGPHPLAVYVHGGFWRAQYDLGHAGHPCAALTAAGIATWNVEYRRLGNPGGGWPGTMLDVAGAADHVRELAREYPLDLDNVVTMGHSAGGQLALWLAGRRRIPPDSILYRRDPLPVRAAISLAGVTDLRAAWRLRLREGIVRDLLGGTPEEVPDRYVAASPMELLPLGVPQVLIHGTADTSVPFALSANYAQAAVLHRDRVTLIPLPRAGHFAPVDPRTAQWQRVLAAVRDVISA